MDFFLHAVRAARGRGSFCQPFQQDLGLAPALLVFFTTGGRQVFRGSFDEAGFGLEVSEGLRGQDDQFLKSQLARFILDELNQFASDALVFVGGTDVEAGELAFAVFRVRMEGHAADRVFIDLKKVIVVELLFDAGAGSFHQFLGSHRVFGQPKNAADIFLQGPSDLLVFVGINQGANAFV